MGLLMILVGLLAAAMALLLALALVQNRGVLADLRGADRPVPKLLRDALVVWSPLALVIVAVAFASNRLAAGAATLTYRLTTIDEFCDVPSVSSATVIPCSDMHGVLDPRLQRRAGAGADLEHELANRFARARKRLLAMPDTELARQAARPGDLLATLSPRAVLGLERAPEDDPELARLKRELLDLVATETPRPRDVLDVVRYVGERDQRIARMRQLTQRVRERRREVNEAAYAEMPLRKQGLLWLRHRLAHLLEPVASRPDPDTSAALLQLASSPAAPGQSFEAARRGLVLMLARNEAASLQVLSKETATARGQASLGLALALPRRCTVAVPDPGLRRRAADFADGTLDAEDPATLVQANAGSFPCFEVPSGASAVPLLSFGFRDSVHASIDRWHDELAASAFRRLGRLSLEAGALPGEAEEATRRMAAALGGPMQLGRARCDWLHPANCAGNAARSAAEASLSQAREELAASVRDEVAGATAGATQSLDARIARTLASLDARIEGSREQAHVVARRWFALHDLLRLLGWLTLALLAVKSFLYVLALETYHHQGELSVGFEGAPAIQGDYRVARRLAIDPAFPRPLVTRKQLSNADNDVRLAPWPWSAPIARILRRRYFVFTRSRLLADAPGAAGGMVASAGGGLSIVEWKLQPGEEVVFRFQDFFGASDNVSLRSQWSLRLSTLLLGHIVFRIATCREGEGRLLLKANVEDNELGDIRALPPERMIAWDRHARFSVHSARTPWKTLLNGYTLVRRETPGVPPGRIVVSSEEASSNLGTIRFVRRMLSALF
jgi:uncharacterized protein (AIM24 family)